MHRALLLLAAVAALLGGCRAINPVEQIPTYVHIDSFRFDRGSVNLNPKPALTASHQVTQVWAYYNNNLIGEFDLPCTFPVITDGTNAGKLQLWPGIVTDGTNNTLDIYPFYYPDTTFVLRQNPGKTTTYEPETGFFGTTKISTTFWTNFESGVPPLLKLVAGVAMTNAPDSLGFEHSVSGSIYMTHAGDSSVDSSGVFAIPAGAAYIEFNYKCDVPFSVALQSNLSTQINATPYSLTGIAPSDHWQKFYLNVRAFALMYPGANYNFYLSTFLPAGQATGRVLIDNIQLVTF